MYPCIVSDEMMDAEEDQFNLDMDLVEAPLSRPMTIPREKGILIDCAQDLFTLASTNLSPKESANVKEVLFKHNETTFHDPVNPFMRTDTIEHEIPTTNRLARITPCRIPYERMKNVEDEILQMEKEGNIQKSSGPCNSPVILVR